MHAKVRVTLIKMDIEGSEMAALKGAEKIIKRDRPKLAVCILPCHFLCIYLTIKNQFSFFSHTITVLINKYVSQYFNFSSDLCGLGSSGSARRYSGNHFCFLLLRLLRCFSSPACPPRAMDSRTGTQGPPCVGSPIQTAG